MEKNVYRLRLIFLNFSLCCVYRTRFCYNNNNHKLFDCLIHYMHQVLCLVIACNIGFFGLLNSQKLSAKYEEVTKIKFSESRASRTHLVFF